MKLLSTYNRATIITAIIVLLASSITYYFMIRIILLQQIDKDLKLEEQEIHEYISEHNSLPDGVAYKGQEIRFEVNKSNDIKREIKSSTIFNASDDESEPVRTLMFPVTVNNILYKAIVVKSQVEAEDLLQFIVLVTASIFLLLLLVTFLINRFLLGKLWRPFYNTLQQLREINLKNAAGLQLPVTNIQEFNELNSSVSQMTQRIKNEYEALKQFTDNASHEMQTPIAIINSKLDLLLQTSSDNQVVHLESIYDAIARLIRLNQALLLLTKIENAQYSNQERINIKTLVEQKFRQFEELLRARNIHCIYKLEDAFVSINKELADLMLNNLFSNAIKHNYEGGYIHCELKSNALSITNSGSPLTFNEEYIFDRFQKSNQSEGTGLGLAIVSQICETSGITLEYSGGNNEHIFKVFL